MYRAAAPLAVLVLSWTWTVPVGGAVPEQAERRIVEFRPQPRGGLAGGGFAGVLRLSSGEEGPAPREVPVPGASGARIALPLGSRWRVCADIEGWWGPCSVLAVDAGSGALPHRMELWPTGRLAGRLRSPEREAELPDALRVSFQTPHTIGREAAIPRSVRDCPLSRDGGWTCELPATALDVAIRVPGFVAERFWGIEVPRGDSRDLGVLVLRRGAFVAGWVRFAEGDGGPAGCTARLFPFVPGGPEMATAERASRTAAEGAVLDNGFVQLGPVAAGTYVLEVTHPGYAPARVFPLRLWRHEETALRDPIVLRRPLVIQIQIDPPSDWRGLPWQVSLERSADLSGSFAGSDAFTGTAAPDGRVLVPDQAPGTFRLRVRDSVGDPFYARQDLVVEDAQDAVVEVGIDLVTIHGEITLRDEPVQGTLWFGGRSGASRVELRSDLEGRFAGVLPRPGWWRLQVDAPEHGFEFETRVEVEPDRHGDAVLRIDVPDTHLFGKVSDEEGRPVAGARVWLRDSLAGARAMSDAAGAFEFRAFEPGPASVGASASTPRGSLTGQPVIVPVVESVPFGPVEIRLTRTRILSGKVISTAGSTVPGALVDLSTLWPVAAAHSASVRTQPDGSFQIEVHPAAEMLQAIVSPPGYALQSLTLPNDQPLNLAVSREHGTLILDRGPEGPEEQRAPHKLVVLLDGVVLPYQRLVEWAHGHGRVWSPGARSVEVPRVAPGNVRACLTRSDEIAGAALAEGDWQAALALCDQGYLAPGATLTLRLPTEAQRPTEEP